MSSAKLAIYATCRALGLFGLARWLTRRRLKILCYHGFELSDETRFRPKLFIDARTFADRLAVIERCGMRVIGLDEAVTKLYSSNLPPNSVVITIDDGFHSVHGVATPLLRMHGFPATVYVTSYYVDRPNPIFRLVIQYMFWKTRVNALTLPEGIGTAGEQFDLRDAEQRERATWEVIYHGEGRCTESERIALSAVVGVVLKVPYEGIVKGNTLHLMTPEQLASLAESGLTVELHTHRHHFSGDDRESAEREILDNRAALQRWLPRVPNHFCYPSGLWTEAQWGWLDQMGVRSSTTCLPGLNSARTPRHALRRFLDGANIHPIEFEAALCGFSDLLRELRAAFGAPLRWLRRWPTT